jgi:hypothetical protein
MSKVFKAVGKAVTGVVKAVVNVVSSVVKAVVNVVSDVISFIASPFMGLLGMPSIPDAAAEAQRQDGVLLTKQGGGANAIPVVYGYRRLGGVITFCETGSTNNKYLWVAYTFCEGPVEGINEIFIDDTQLSTDVVRGLNSGQIVEVPDAKYKGRVQFQFFPGVFFSDPAQSSVGTISILKDAPSWKASMAYNGLAVLMARYEWKTATTQAEADANPFSGNIPQIQVSILGKKVASLRTGAGTENSNYQGSGYLERYSTNPAECLLDYLRNPRYGKGLANTDIDWDSFYIAAQKCNQEISYTTSVRGPILTMNIVVDTNQTLFASVKNILLNFRGYLPYVQGKYKLKIEDAGNPTDIMSGAATIAAVFNRDSILGEITYTGIERNAKYNQVVVTYVDPDQKFSTQQVVYPESEVERQVYIGFDGGRENKSEVTFAGITNQQIARDMARLIFNKSRFQETCSLTVSAEGFNLEPGDNIFINSNILNFGTTPWRVISSKLTNDYTFELGCVRNPDFIYPYVIPNTPDTVVAPYIPKGASILPPLSGGQSLIGLVPPVTAPLLPPAVVPISTATNPPATVTTGTNGGGVGGSTSTINIGGGTPPVTPPVTNVLTDAVDVTNTRATASAPGFANVDITFTQPENAMYQGVQVYYKFPSRGSDVWTETFVPTSGAGRSITFRLNNLISQPSSYYDVRMRVKYTSGEYSTRITQFQAITSNTELGTNISPQDSAVSISAGWSLPTTGAPVRNDYIGFITALRLTSGGAALTPRAISITVQQDIRDKAPNPDITGLKVYYKSSLATYWDEALLPFSNYITASQATVTLSGLGVPGAPQAYDLILRFAYRDGSESQVQTRYQGIFVQTSAANFAQNSNNADAFNPLDGFSRQELSSSFTLQTTAMAPTGTITDTRDTKIGLEGVFPIISGGQQTAYWHIKAPTDATAAANWLGINVYYRRVTPGENPAYTKVTIKGLNTSSVGAVETRLFTLPLLYDTEYQVLIVPLVLYNGAETEGGFSWFGQGYYHLFSSRADYPIGGNWIGNFKFRLDATSLLLGALQTGFVSANAVAIVNRWELVGNGNQVVTSRVIQNHYRLAFSVSHITSFEEAYIWRRKVGRRRDGEATYFGVGRWEKITLTTAITGSRYNSTSQQFTVNLKLPISFTEFVRTPATVTTATMLASTPANPLKRVDPPGTSNFGPASEEFYLQVRSNGVTSPQAIKLVSILPDTSGLVNIIGKLGPPKEVVFADAVRDDLYDAGWQRKTTEARTATNAAVISAPNIIYGGLGSTAAPGGGDDFISGAL